MKLEFNFDKDAKLEILPRSESNEWVEVSVEIFRSWGGSRRINGKEFKGDVYFMGTNEIVRHEKLMNNIDKTIEEDDDIVNKLKDLHDQATTEKSHYYVASTCKEAIIEIERLRELLKTTFK